MAKEIDMTELQDFKPENINPDVTVTSELLVTENVTKSNSGVTKGNSKIPELPATKSAVAAYFGTSHQNLTKTWLKPLLDKGYEFYIGKKISEDGFETLAQLMSRQKESGLNPKEFIERLPEAGQPPKDAQLVRQVDKHSEAQVIEYSALEVVKHDELIEMMQQPRPLEVLNLLAEAEETAAQKEVEATRKAREESQQTQSTIARLLKAKQIKEKAQADREAQAMEDALLLEQLQAFMAKKPF